jgi:tetratricopeptide (TPR) repeat protein
VALAPDLARTQIVLGFAALTRIDIDQAKASFERAIALDSANPLSRLGLGLAVIRSGALERGRKDIQIAAALDPNDSLIRSYLGKAYFEERRDPLDAEQYAIAKQLDPNDPTPWFYDAIRLQTVNRPVEALHNIQRSIELNDNRAVYRSRLLLDEDLAVRQVSLVS